MSSFILALFFVLISKSCFVFHGPFTNVSCGQSVLFLTLCLRTHLLSSVQYVLVPTLCLCPPLSLSLSVLCSIRSTSYHVSLPPTYCLKGHSHIREARRGDAARRTRVQESATESKLVKRGEARRGGAVRHR